MSKYERIVHIPSVIVSAGSIESIDELFTELAEERITHALAERARQLYRQGNAPLLGVNPNVVTEEAFVIQVCLDDNLRSTWYQTHGVRTTYISPHGSVQFLGDDFSAEDVPKDLQAIFVEAQGASERVLALNVKADTQPMDFANPNLNRILIQSNMEDRAWVNDKFEHFRKIAESEKSVGRDLVYRWLPLFVWAAFFSLAILEYRFANWLTGFSWNAPLNGLQILVTFIVLTVSLIGASFLFLRLLPHAFPYFEIEGNLSRKRLTVRKPLIIFLTSLYTAAVIAPFLEVVLKGFKDLIGVGD